MCNCNKGGGASTVQRSGTGPLPVGYDETNPLVIGEPDDVVRRVRVLVATSGLAIASKAWVTGDGVQALINSGSLFDITSTAQLGRLWRVGGFTYTSYQEASRASAAMGLPVIEVA